MLRGWTRDRGFRLVRLAVATWFVTLATVRAASVLGNPLVDGRLYRAAAEAWLHGSNPWRVQVDGLYFAAPPPSLLPMVPFVAIPEPYAGLLLAAISTVGALWAIRRWRLPVWWIAFPPLVDGIVNANPHVLVLPLLAGAGGWLAPVVKAYAAPVLLLHRGMRAALAAGIVLLATAPILPWRLFLDELPWVLELFRVQVGGRFTVWGAPILLPAAVLALAWIGRERAAWWVVPAFWPSTQYYYNSLALPAATPVAAMVLCAQFDGVAAVALIVSAMELEVFRRVGGAAWRPLDWRQRRVAPPSPL